MAVYDADDLKILFSLFDANRNGKLESEEIKELVTFIAGERVDDKEMERFMQAVDINKDGIITIDEFEVLITQHFRMIPLGVRTLFQTFDLNSDGYVDRDEFNQVIKDKAEFLNERKIGFFTKILTRKDTDRVNYQQFLDAALEHYRDYVANREQ